MKVTALKSGISLWHLTAAASHAIFRSLFLYTRSVQSSRPFTRALLRSLHLSRWGRSVRVHMGEGVTVRANQVEGYPSLSKHLTLMPLGEIHRAASSQN